VDVGIILARALDDAAGLEVEEAREGDLLGLSPGDMLSKSSWAATLTAMGPATASPSAPRRPIVDLLLDIPITGLTQVKIAVE
jgi:hypothetical protein